MAQQRAPRADEVIAASSSIRIKRLRVLQVLGEGASPVCKAIVQCLGLGADNKVYHTPEVAEELPDDPKVCAPI